MSETYRGQDHRNRWQLLPNFLKVAGASYLCGDDGFLLKRSDEGLTALRGRIVEVAPSSVGRDTGKKDKNDKSIFEGDLLKVSTTCYVVENSVGGFIAKSMTQGQSDQSLTSEFAATAEIVGNITDDAVITSAESGSTELFGHTVSDLQTSVSVSGGAVTGTLKYVSTGALPAVWGAGYFLALKFENRNEGASVRVGLSPSAGSGLAELDEDMNAVFKITDKSKQLLVVESFDGTFVNRHTYTLSGLTLAAQTG